MVYFKERNKTALIDTIRQDFDNLYPFSLLSNVILYRNDRGDLDLFANEIDYLFHYIKNNENRLVIIEVKEREIYGDTPSQAPTSDSQWQLLYNNGIGNSRSEVRAKNIRKQVTDQATALNQFCSNISNNGFKIECWIVDKRSNSENIVQDNKNPLLKLLTLSGFKEK